MVLNAALRKTVDVGEGSQKTEIKIADIDIIKAQSDPGDWLFKHLRIRAPKDTEILAVSLSRPVKEQALALVKAVIDAYQNEGLDIDRKNRLKRLNELETAFTRKEADLRTKRSRLKDLGQEAGTTDTQALAFRQQMLLQGCSDVRHELVQIQTEKCKAQGDLTGQEAIANDQELAKSMQVTPGEYAQLLNYDPLYRELSVEKFFADRMNAMDRINARDGFAPEARMRRESMKAMMDQALESRRKDLQKEVRENTLAKGQVEILKLRSQVAILGSQEAVLQAKLTELDKKSQQVGALSTDLDMLRNDIKQSEDVLNGIAKERDHLTVELASSPRVSVVQPPEVSPAPSQLVRLASTAFALLAGSCLPVFALLWWDTRKQRINSLDEVANQTGVEVLARSPLCRTAISTNWFRPTNGAAIGRSCSPRRSTG